jgi:tRNA(Ile)-lysidine synthase
MGGVDLPAHLRERLAELAPKSGKLLAAVSGGADSVALLHGLVEAGFAVAVGHLDHALRPESAEDARFVAQLAAALGLEARLERVDVAEVAGERGWNVEDAARRVRYEFLTRAAREAGANAVVTAHTLDDQAETVLMQLLRGAAYLRGMPQKTGNVVRPLLDVPGSRLRYYLTALGQAWREDPTNRDRRWLRAWLRNEILPALCARFPDLPVRLGRHARLQADIEALLRSEARRLLRDRGFDRRELEVVAPALQREAIRLLFDAAGVAPASERIEEVRRHLGRETPYRLTVAPGKSLRLAYGRLELATRPSPAPADQPVTEAAQLPPGVPESVLGAPGLELRARRPGDRMRLAGGSKSLARLLIDRKVPREERDALKVLASGSQVLWAERIGVAADIPADVAEASGSTRTAFGQASGSASQDADLRYMRRALELADAAAAAGELPVGAVVVCAGEVLGEGHNETERSKDPSAHAEVLALRRAAAARGDWRLSGCTLYVTLEPCPMCAGAVLESHVGRVVYGARNVREGAYGSVADLRSPAWKRRVSVEGGLLARDAGERLSRFFAARREE